MTDLTHVISTLNPIATVVGWIVLVPIIVTVVGLLVGSMFFHDVE